MSSKKQINLKLNAITMRILLSASLVIILLSMAIGFYFAYSFLKTTANELTDTNQQAKNIDSKLNNLARIEKELAKYKESIQKAEKIVAESNSYQYQDQVVRDITSYAHKSNISVSSIIFKPSATAANKGSSAKSSSAPVASSSAKSTTVSIQIANGAKYEDLLRFLYYIEQNLTKMQVASVSLARGENPGTVSAQSIDLEVYLK